jgi:hypothetical protein
MLARDDQRESDPPAESWPLSSAIAIVRARPDDALAARKCFSPTEPLALSP